jgi:hypothetical protein
MAKNLKKYTSGAQPEEPDNNFTLLTRAEIIEFLKSRRILESGSDENASEHLCNSGTVASVHDFERKGWDSPY